MLYEITDVQVSSHDFVSFLVDAIITYVGFADLMLAVEAI